MATTRQKQIAKWRHWRDAVQAPCPVKSDNKQLCRMAICPCRRFKRYEMDKWFDDRLQVYVKAELPGRFGALMKLSRWFEERDGNG